MAAPDSSGRDGGPRPPADMPADMPADILPRFVTPQWLRERYNLTKQDIRRLSKLLAGNYEEWPDEGTELDDEAFFENIHMIARRLPYFFLELSRMIECVVQDRKYSIGSLSRYLKGRYNEKFLRKCMLHNAMGGDDFLEMGRELGLLDASAPDTDGRENLARIANALIIDSDGARRDELAWLFNFLCLAGGAWRHEPGLDPLVRLWIEQADCRPNLWEAEHLVDRLMTARSPGEVGRLADEGARLADSLEKAVNDQMAGFKAELDGCRTMEDVHDVMAPGGRLYRTAGGIVSLRQHIDCARAATLTAELRASLGRLGERVSGDGTDERRRPVAERLGRMCPHDDSPAAFPEASEEACRECVRALEGIVDRAGDGVGAERAAAEAFGREPSQENRERLEAAMAASREPFPVDEAMERLDSLDGELDSLRERFGSWRDMKDEFMEEFEELWSVPDDGSHDLEDERRKHLQARDELARVQAELESAHATHRSEVARLKDEMSRLKAENQRLAGRLEGQGAPGPGGPAAGAGPKPVPDRPTYDGLPGWVTENFGERVVLLPRACQSLKKAKFEDVGLVYRAVGLLGTDYWDMRTRSAGEDGFRKRYEESLQALRLEDTPSTTATGTGLARDSFHFEWGERKLMLNRHLKNRGPGHDPKRCFRLYYTWDEDSQAVLVGHLPGHMKTSLS